MAIAIKEGGSANPDFNARLRDCIAKAKANNMPNDNIKRTLDKYSGANGQVDYEANNYEGYGVGGVAVVVETLTDNKNRTVADVRHLFDKYGAGLGASGCVSWQFDKKGVIIMESEGLDEDAVMMQALDAALRISSLRKAFSKSTLLRMISPPFVRHLRRKATPSHRPSCRWFRRTTSPLRRKRIWRRCVSCSTTSRTTTTFRPFGTTGRMRMITRVNAPVTTA